MDKEKYIHDFESLSHERSQEDYPKNALAELHALKKHWKKDKIPNSRGLLGFLFSKTQFSYHPQHYLNSLTYAAAKQAFSMPYTALYQVSKKGENFNIVQNALFQSNRLRMLFEQPLENGMDHCIGFANVLHGLAAADTECVEKLLPLRNGASQHGAFTNLFMGMWYRDLTILEKGRKQTVKLLSLKSTTKQDQAIAKYLSELAEKNTLKACDALHEICNLVAYGKGASLINHSALGQYLSPQIHGLFNLAYYTLGKNQLDSLACFDHLYFCKEYSQYLLENKYPKPKIYVSFTDEMELINQMLVNLPSIYIYKKGKTQLTDTERYQVDRLELVEKNLDLENYFRLYNQ